MKPQFLFKLSALAALVLLAVGCSKIDGNVDENQRPSVSFINNQQDADSSTQFYLIPDYAFIFKDTQVGFEEDPANGTFPVANDVWAKFELIRYQFFFIDSLISIERVNPDGTLFPVPTANYRVDENIPRYLWIQHTTEFQWELGRRYIINGRFKYQPVYSYSPMVFWKGTDPDGFVEAYRFIDYTYVNAADYAAFSQRVAVNDPTLIWTETANTQAVINLRTELGQIQKHVIFVQAVDNEGAISAPALRTFNRSNRAPNSPKMAYYKDGYTRVPQPSEYKRHIIGWEDIETNPDYVTYMVTNVSPFYEIPVATEELQNWRGLRFLVSGNDPDDQALVTIPLKFQFLLHRIPSTWMAAGLIETDNGMAVLDSLSDAEAIVLSDSNVVDFETHLFDADFFSNLNQIELYNLTTGFYQLTVFSRDDGMEKSAEPSWMRFKVQQLDQDLDVLVLDITPSDVRYIGYATKEEYVASYKDLIGGAMPYAKLFARGVSDYQVVWKDEVPEGADFNCRYWEMHDGNENNDQLPFSELSRYHTIIVLDDRWASSPPQGNSVRFDWIANPMKGFLMDYLDMGGSLFWTGFSSLFGTFNYSNELNDNVTNTAITVEQKAGDFLSRYMGILGVYGDVSLTFNIGRLDACLGATPGSQGGEPLAWNHDRIDLLRGLDRPQPLTYNSFYFNQNPVPYRPYAPDSSLVFVEAYAINENAGTRAVYTYESYSANIPPHDTLSFFRVASQADLPQIFYAPDETNYIGQDPWYPYYSTNPDESGCWLYVPVVNFSNMPIERAFNAWNRSRTDGMWAEPILVSHGKGSDGLDKVFVRVNHQRIADPANFWLPGDEVDLDLVWQPILQKHRKPVIFYTENLAYQGNIGGFNYNPFYTNFRTCFSGIPLHMVQVGQWPTSPMDMGTGSRGFMSDLLTAFYARKLQELYE